MSIMKIDQPVVSVAMVTRNVERYLEEAIESILNQTFRDFEFIIVDFGSTDKSKDIAARYAAKDSRVKPCEIPPCSYIEAKIAACALPRGRYIAIQDADDVSLPDRLKQEVEFLDAHPSVGLLGGAVQWIDSQGQLLASDGNYPTDDPEIRVRLEVGNAFWHPTVLMRREAYTRVGGYRPVFSQSDDYDLWLRISEHYQCANLRQKVLHYRIHPQQLSLTKKKEQILCALAAQAAAALRKEGKPDALDVSREITPELLAQMGVSRVRQDNSLAEGYVYWIKQLYAAGEYQAVIATSTEMFRSCEKRNVRASLVSDAYILSAKASWKQRKIFRGLVSSVLAVRTRPVILRQALTRLRKLIAP
jgi:glycosyltransferase involved in cell wall biosynthesis